MNGINHIREKKCPKCGENVYIEGVDVEVGYYYPPLHCECGWNESEEKICLQKANHLIDELI